MASRGHPSAGWGNANLGDQLAETRAFAERVTAKLDQIQQLVTAERFNSIKQELDFLKARLDVAIPELIVPPIPDQAVPVISEAIVPH